MSSSGSRTYHHAASTNQDEDLMETQFEIKTENCGYLNVYVQGKVENIQATTPVFFTLHDIGTNHHEYHKFVEHTSVKKVKHRSVWIHVDLPGQEFDSIDLPPYFDFPSFDKICQDLIEVLNHFQIKHCITFGEGAGANILLRFSMSFPERVLGNILIHCVASVESMANYFQEKVMSWKLNTIGMNASVDQYLVYHKFGMYLDSRKDLVTEKTIKDFLDKLHKRINPKNLRLYVNAYLNRSDLSNLIKDKLNVDTMIACGSYPSLRHVTDEMQTRMNPKLTTRVNIEHCGSILDEFPEVLAYNLILFCQGLGLCNVETDLELKLNFFFLN